MKPGRRDAWIVSGLSGAGKSTALAALERHGFACVDNLPPGLLDHLAAQARVAAVIDARQGRDVAAFTPPTGWRVLFLDARNQVLVRRLSESTRPHPCASVGGGEAAVRAERALLEAMRAAADVVIDSSELSAEQLAAQVVAAVAPGASDADAMLCTVSSFGFKYGLPSEADWVADARFLRNPFWEPSLRPLTGMDPAVRDYVLAQGPASEFIERLGGLLTWTVQRAVEHRRSRLHLAVGCTGGRHRSVVVATELAGVLRAAGIAVCVRHRDVERPDPR